LVGALPSLQGEEEGRPTIPDEEEKGGGSGHAGDRVWLPFPKAKGEMSWETRAGRRRRGCRRSRRRSFRCAMSIGRKREEAEAER